jgi:hypothetical protein
VAPAAASRYAGSHTSQDDKMRAWVLGLGAILAAAPHGARAQSGGFVATLGTDTVHIERFTRSGNELEGTILTRTPITLRTRYSMILDGDGRPVRYEMEIRRGDGTPLRGPGTAGSFTYTADSVIRVTRQRDGRLDTAGVAASAAVWPTASVPYIGVSYLIYELAFADARRRGASEPELAMPLWTMVAAQKAPEQRPVWLIGRDSAEMSYFGVARSGYRFDPDGRLLRADWRGTTYHYRITRVPAPDLESLAAAWTEADAGGRRMGPLSPRDTTRATVGAALVLVDYSRPARRGRAIWGALVPWDTIWRLGADFATHLVAGADLRVGDRIVPAGTYTLWMHPSRQGQSWLVINRRTRIFGTFYDGEADVARIGLTRSALAEPAERLTIAIEAGHLWIRWGDVAWSTTVEASDQGSAADRAGRTPGTR